MNSKDNGADRSESDERGDAGWACARRAAAYSAGPAGLAHRAMGAEGSAAPGILPIELFDGLIAARAVLNFFCEIGL